MSAGVRSLAAALLLVLVGGCGILGPGSAEIVEVPDEWLVGIPAGPVVLVASGSIDGTDWSVYAHLTADGACISWRWPQNGGGGECGLLPEPGTFGILGIGQDEEKLLLVGMVSRTPGAVRVDYGAGRIEDARLVSLDQAGIEALAYAVLVTDDSVERILLVDDGGNVTDEAEVVGP